MAGFGFYQLNGTVNSYGNTLETVFCTRFDNLELLSPVPTLFDGFGCSLSHAPIELRITLDMVTETSEVSHPVRPFDFERVNYKHLFNALEGTDW